MAARVLLLRSKSPAGIEPRLAKVAATLARGGHEVHVLLWDRERAHAAMESLGGVTIHRYRVRAPEGQPGLVRRLPGWWWHVLRTSLRLRPDVVHAVDLDTVLPAFAAARILRAFIRQVEAYVRAGILTVEEGAVLIAAAEAALAAL